MVAWKSQLVSPQHPDSSVWLAALSCPAASVDTDVVVEISPGAGDLVVADHFLGTRFQVEVVAAENLLLALVLSFPVAGSLDREMVAEVVRLIEVVRETEIAVVFRRA